MFEKIISKNSEEDAPPPPPPVTGSAPPASTGFSTSEDIGNHLNILLPDVEVSGTVEFEDNLIIKGKVDGEIHSSGVLTIGETAKIKAEIKTGSLVVNGKVHGNITVADSVDLQRNAEVIGDIKARTLTMAAGAIFVGNSTIGAPSGGSSSSSPPKPKKEKPSEAPSTA